MPEKILPTEWHQSQRGYFTGSLFNAMVDDPRIRLVTIDLGFGMFDKIKEIFPDRFINTFAAEQAALGICVGMSLEGLVPFCYTITSFYLRAAETIALYAHGEQIPIKMFGSGRDGSYEHDGPSHHGGLAQAFMGSLNIVGIHPNTKEEIPGVVKEVLYNGKPTFVTLLR